MSEDAWGGVGAGGDLLQICPADAAGVDADQEFAFADFGDWNSFQADVIDPAIHQRLHGGGNSVESIFFCEFSGYVH